MQCWISWHYFPIQEILVAPTFGCLGFIVAQSANSLSQYFASKLGLTWTSDRHGVHAFQLLDYLHSLPPWPLPKRLFKEESGFLLLYFTYGWKRLGFSSLQTSGHQPPGVSLMCHLEEFLVHNYFQITFQMDNVVKFHSCSECKG